MAASANPFRYGRVVSDEFFTDRETELETLLGDLRGGQDVLLIAPRRLGKTSLVKQAIDRLRSEGALVAYLDLLDTPTKADLCAALARSLYNGLLSPAERALDRVREFFSRLAFSPRVTLGDDGRPQFEFLAYEQADLDRVLGDLLELPARVAADTGSLVVVCLDEFQELVAIDDTLPGKLRAVIQQQQRVAHVYLGSERHLMEPLFMNRAGPLYRSAKPLRLGPIAPEAFASFIRARCRSGGLEIADDALGMILAETNGLPYETQELCSFAWAEARLAGRGEVDATVVTDALDELLRAEQARYLAVWERLSPRQRSLLQALAREPGEVYAAAYLRRHRLHSASSVQSSLAVLERQGLVEPREGGGWRIADVFLTRWLNQRDPTRP